MLAEARQRAATSEVSACSIPPPPRATAAALPELLPLRQERQSGRADGWTNYCGVGGTHNVGFMLPARRPPRNSLLAGGRAPLLPRVWAAVYRADALGALAERCGARCAVLTDVASLGVRVWPRTSYLSHRAMHENASRDSGTKQASPREAKRFAGGRTRTYAGIAQRITRTTRPHSRVMRVRLLSRAYTNAVFVTPLGVKPLGHASRPQKAIGEAE